MSNALIWVKLVIPPPAPISILVWFLLPGNHRFLHAVGLRATAGGNWLMLLVALVVNPLLVWWKIRRNPFRWCWPARKRRVCLFTRSSAANIPVNMARKLNLDRDTYSFLFRWEPPSIGGRSNHHYRVDAGCG